MDAQIEAVLTDYEARQEDEDLVLSRLTAEELARRRDEFMVSVGRATGTFLNLLARQAGARSLLELGTSAGYSTLWLAEAARATRGKVITVDVAADKQRQAQEALARAGLSAFVECHTNDAVAFLASTTLRFDFVLIDVWKETYIACLDALLDRLEHDAVVIADNMLRPAVVRLAAGRYQAHVAAIPALQTVVLPIGHGLAVSRYRSRAQVAPLS